MTDERIRILVVDDDPALLDTLREYLENLGSRYIVETAGLGSEALWMVARARPHVVILDVEMPGMTGSSAHVHPRSGSHHPGHHADGEHGRLSGRRDVGVGGRFLRPQEAPRGLKSLRRASGTVIRYLYEARA